MRSFCLVVLLLLGTNVHAQQSFESLDAAVNRAMETSPQVQTVRAKFETLEAELASVRQQVAIKIGELWEQLQKQHLVIQQLERTIVTAEQQNDADARMNAELAMAIERTKLDRLHAELRGAVGAHHRRPLPNSTGEANSKHRGLTKDKAAQLTQLLETKVDADFTEAALVDVLGFFNEQCKASLYSHPDFRGEPVTLRVKGTTLLGALQAIEDLFPDREFFVREYGLLLYHRDQGRDARGFLPLSEFVKRKD